MGLLCEEPFTIAFVSILFVIAAFISGNCVSGSSFSNNKVGRWLPLHSYRSGELEERLIPMALAAKQRNYSVFIAHDLDRDNTRLLRGRRISAVLHHDLKQDMRRACYAIMQAHHALPGAAYSWPSNIHIITPYNMPAPAPHDG